MLDKIYTTVDGLADTALEKIMSLGYEDAKADIMKIREVIEDLTNFWELDPELLEEFDKMIEVCK